MVWFYRKAYINMNDFKLNSNAPNGELHTKWEDYKKTLNKLTPEEANKYKVIIIGTGLAGASAAATLAEKGFNIHAFSYHESPRRAHSIAAQGGINAAKNYKQDGDSVMRLFL
jgi:succinate dehydrogenase / fumarate reductase flavoprotein subunit